MNDTYAGSVIRTTHELRLIVKTPNCITDPTIIVPLRIGNKPPTKTGFVSNAPIYGQSMVGTPMILPAHPPSDQDGDFVVLPSAPPAGWSHPVVSTHVAVPDSEIRIGGYENSLNQSYVTSVSFDSLLAEMDRSLNDLDVVTTHANDSDWDNVLRSMTPMQLGQLISKVRYSTRYMLCISFS